MQQTAVCIVCDWLISNSTSKDDVERSMSKDSCYARNTESGYKTKVLSVLFSSSFRYYLEETCLNIFCSNRILSFYNQYKYT